MDETIEKQKEGGFLFSFFVWLLSFLSGPWGAKRKRGGKETLVAENRRRFFHEIEIRRLFIVQLPEFWPQLNYNSRPQLPKHPDSCSMSKLIFYPGPILGLNR